MLELQPIFFLSAFLAGIFMFLAPCTLPLLPAYLGFISGVTEKELSNEKTKKWASKRIFKNSLMFTFGFSLVFILSGMSAGLLGASMSPFVGKMFKLFGGVIIIIFGLFMIGLLKLPFLTKERRIKIPKWLTVGTPLSSFLLGSAFAIGWTPCIGPVYGTILIYASDTNTAFAGAALLAVFSIGFSLPLILLAFLIGNAAHLIEKINPYLRVISIFGGFVLIILGVSFLFGNTYFTNWFFGFFENIDLTKMLMSHI